MIVVVDERSLVTSGYSAWFAREGITTTGFSPDDFGDWVATVQESDIMAVEAFLLGECANRNQFPHKIRERCAAPVIAVNETQSLEHTLEPVNTGRTADPLLAMAEPIAHAVMDRPWFGRSAR